MDDSSKRGSKAASQIHKDAEGQFAPSGADRHASGVVSAKPTAITGSEDATAHSRPPAERDGGEKDNRKA